MPINDPKPLYDQILHGKFDDLLLDDNLWDDDKPGYELPPKVRDLALDLLQKNREAMEKEGEKRGLKSSPCTRCGNIDIKRAKASGSRNNAQGKARYGRYCTNVLACEREAWPLPCCQYCHEQFHPEHHQKCDAAPMDPWGNQPHIPGGRFWSPEQKKQVDADAAAKKLIEASDKASANFKELKKIAKDVYFCEVCGRTEKPIRPTKCLECSKKMGWRKGY